MLNLIKGKIICFNDYKKNKKSEDLDFLYRTLSVCTVTFLKAFFIDKRNLLINRQQDKKEYRGTFAERVNLNMLIRHKTKTITKGKTKNIK